jgi:predicted methyltransferase
MMRGRLVIMIAAATAICAGVFGAGAITAKDTVPAYVAAAVADPDRPDASRDRDAARKPAETLAFIGVKPGQKIVDFMPGRPPAYFTILFSDVVGPKGTVYAWMPQELAKMSKQPFPASGSRPDPKHQNIVFLSAPADDFTTPAPVDIVWTAQNYHDLHDPFMGPVDMAKFDKAVFNALKPGGVFVILDHAAPAGSGVSDTNTLHRIDPAVVKKEVEAAGFRFVSESNILRNPDDPHTKLVFDPSIRGHTDQFIYKFRKP